MKKRILSIILAALMIVTVTACSNTAEGGDISSSTSTQGGDAPSDLPGDSVAVLPENVGKYVYLSLTDDEKSLYDQILTAAENFEEKVVFDKAYDTTTTLKIYRNVYFQEPEIFWLNAGSAPFENAGETMSELPLDYRYTKDEAATMKTDIENAFAEIEKTFPANATDADKIIAIHDYIALKTAFSKDDMNSKDAYGALVADYAQCEGYAKGFAYACNHFGIDNVRITGNKYNGLSHAWNKVFIDGKWYNVDLTWDDPEGTTGDFVRHNYVFVSDAQINGKTHLVECDFTPPVADGELDYFKHTGKYAKTKDEAIELMQKEMIANAENEAVACQIKCENAEAYTAAVSYIWDNGGYKTLIENTNNAPTTIMQVKTISMSNDEEMLIIHINLKY